MAVYNWRSFESARKFVHSLNLKSKNEWEVYAKSNAKPKDIPHAAWQVYKNKGWISFGDWLGTGTIATFNIQYRTYGEARKFAHSINARTGQEWEEYCKSGKKPDDIPNAPGVVYKNKSWKGWEDFLNKKAKPKKERYRQFRKARKFVQSLNLKSLKYWEEYCKSGKKPNDIPYHPERHYKEWKGAGDWLGTGFIAPVNRQYRSYEEAREFVKKLKLKNMEEWKRYSKSGKKPDDIPANPYQTYKEKFKLGDFLGTGRISNQDRKYKSYNDAKKFVQSLGIKSYTEWTQYRKSGKRPDDISSDPYSTYKKDWKGWGDFLGTENVAPSNAKFLPWPEAKKEYQRLGGKYGLANRKEFMKFFRKNPGKLPKNLPLAPWMYYTKAKVWERMKK